jgi:hypothetical protein
MKHCSVKAGFLLVAITAVALTMAPVYGVVESVEVLPSVVAVGQPIIFFGMVSGSTIGSRLAVQVYVGANCPATGAIASKYTVASNETRIIANSTVAAYNVTLAFPVTSSSGWVVEQQYQNEMPVGSYSVGVQDVAFGSSLCKNFTVTNQPVAEFLEAALTISLAFLAPLYLLRRRRKTRQTYCESCD